MTTPTPEQRNAMAEKSSAIFDQTDVNYITLSAIQGQACANCVFYQHDHYGDSDFPSCHIVRNWPDPIEPTGWCDRWEVKPEPPPPPVDVADAIDNLATAIESAITVELSDDGRRDLYITPSDGIAASLRKSITGKLKTGLSVLKDAAGRRYMFMVTSNGYKDRDKEHVATKALEAYVKACWTGDDTAFVGDNAHYIWHVKALGSISDLMFADVWSGFLVEMWREQDDPIAKAFYNFVERHDEIEWGASHGFQGVLKSDTFTHINKFESSSLPLDAAANLLTLSEVLPMSVKSKRDSFLDQLFKEEFGIEGAAAILHAGPDQLRAELEKKGVTAKALGEGSDALKQARADAISGNADLLISMIEVQDDFEKQLTDGNKQIADQNKTIADLQKQVQGYETEVKDLRAIVNAGPRRPIDDDSTVVTDEAALKKAKEQNADYDQELSAAFGAPVKKQEVK